MTTEEKAKAYDEALERARRIKNGEGDWRYSDLAEITPALTDIFPQLCESEDERIRKWLIDDIKRRSIGWTHSEFTGEQILAWLEKQKEQKPLSTEETELNSLAFLSQMGYTCIPQELQPVMIQWTGKNLKEVIDFTGKSPKFGEWFKSWDEFEEYVHSHDDILKLFCEDGSHYEVPVGAWIVKTPDGYNIPSRFRFVQKPAEWSEKHIADIFEKVGLAKIAREQGNDELTNALQDAMLELSRMENAEWGEEDEERAKEIKSYLTAGILPSIDRRVACVEWLKTRLKSLRPSWKPSEEQIHAIIEALKYLPNNKDEWRILDTLVDVFKKLM